VTRPVVLVLGGYGVFGRRISANLAKRPEIDVIIAGRHPAAAQELIRTLRTERVRPLGVDLSQPAAISTLVAAKPTVLVDTLGPFQSRNLALPRRCAEHGIHYVDIADARTRATDIASLDAAARLERAAIISGASTVPAFTTAIVDELVPNPREVVAIDVGISPGHRTPRGIATVSAILGYCGQPIPPVCGDAETYGWGDLTRYPYPYPALEEAHVRAGLEVSLLHLGLAALSRGVRLRILPRLGRCARAFNAFAGWLDRFGTDAGAMHVSVIARDAHARTTSRTATLIAEHGDGPQVPAAPACAVVKKLLALPGYVPLGKRGAFACVGVLTRAEIMAELADFSIRYSVDR
jgi:hypothetical protein